MAQYWPWQILAVLFKRDTSTEVPSSAEHYLELARKCMAHTKKMTSSRGFAQLQFNHEQCEHLADKLEWAVQSTESCVRFNPPGRDREEAIGIFKHLYRCAKEIETFIQSCGEAKWVQAAVVLSNVYNSEHICSLDFDLDFFRILARNNRSLEAIWDELLELDLAKSKDFVNDIVARDQRDLVSRLEAMYLESSNLASETHQLVRHLLLRLRHRVSRTVDSEVWEIDLSSLKQVQTLGSGTFGTVRKSIWLGVEVAEKTFHGTNDQSDFHGTNDQSDIHNEVRILAGLTHPNIVRLLGYGMDESGCSIVMELMDGDLRLLMDQRLRLNPSTRAPFSIAEAVDKMLQTAKGMLYLHENNVVHRDLKSTNILVKSMKDVDGEYIYLKVTDFGLSKTKEKSSSYSDLTANIGTTRWMAPELMRQGDKAEKELNHPFKVDVYSFGMVCSEILTGRIPFSSTRSPSEVRRMVLGGERPQLPAECPPDLYRLIVACWDSNARRRPSFAKICKRLKRVKYLLMGVPCSPEQYIKLAKKCVAHAKKMTSTRGSTQLQFNRGQCAHIANRLEAALGMANFFESYYPPGRNREEAIGIFKHLYRCAKEIETFIQSCGEAKWVQAAVVQSNVYNSEHVCSLDFDLDFLVNRLSVIDHIVVGWDWLFELGANKSRDLLNEIVARDQQDLVSRLEAMNPESSEPAVEMHQLVKYLLERLRQRVSGTVDSEMWKIDLSSLKRVQTLGTGSFGTVRKSIWLGVEVGEKTFHATDHQSEFCDEVRILTGLIHPNIVRLLGYGMDKRGCSIVMELMDGDLKLLMDQRVRRNPLSLVPFSTAEAVDKMLQTAEGILYLHENNVVHGDLKSQNILVKCRKDVDGEYIYVKVADFGLSKTKERSSSYSNLTANMGSSRWMAPELMWQGDQAGEELKHPFQVDVYSFGMVCSEILTGRIPFSSTRSPSEVRRMVLEGERPQLPAECPPDLNRLIVSCWDPNASQRPFFAEICRTLRRLKFFLMGGSNDIIDPLQVAQ